MRQESGKLKEPAEKVVRDIRRATRKQYPAEEKIRVAFPDHPRLGAAQHRRQSYHRPSNVACWG